MIVCFKFLNNNVFEVGKQPSETLKEKKKI